jgi:hypothetical protein
MLRETRSTVCAWLIAALAAQAPAPPKSEAELDQQAIQALLGFARTAETYKSPSRAREAYEQIVEHYDTDHAASRTGLGWKKVKEVWQLVTQADKLPKDAATPAQSKQVDEAWRIASKRVAALHETFAFSLDAGGNRARAVYHFERALVFAPDDLECHRALGHEELDGFFGTAEEIAFVRRMRAIFAKAREIADLPITVEAAPAIFLPAELKEVAVQFSGARSKHTTYWVAGDEEEAQRCAIANERAVMLLQFLFGDDPEKRQYLKPSPVRWIVVLRSPEQRAQLLEKCPAARDNDPLAKALLVGGSCFASKSGAAEWVFHYANDEDHAVGQATKRGTPWFNSGLGEGLVHTMTWLLCGTMHSSYMVLPATQAEKQKRPERPSEWLASLREDIAKGEDWPLVQVPRERMENFRVPVRLKSWSFMTWLLARHPDHWVELLVELGRKPSSPEEVATIFTQVLGHELGEVEEEWRAWARAGSRIGKASGLPQ